MTSKEILTAIEPCDLFILSLASQDLIKLFLKVMRFWTNMTSEVIFCAYQMFCFGLLQFCMTGRDWYMDGTKNFPLLGPVKTVFPIDNYKISYCISNWTKYLCFFIDVIIIQAKNIAAKAASFTSDINADLPPKSLQCIVFLKLKTLHWFISKRSFNQFVC